MANIIQIQGGVSISTEVGNQACQRAFNLTQAGTKNAHLKQSVGTSPETVITNDLANLRYLSIYNPAASTGTITVTAAPIVLVPGDIMTFPPSSLLVTMQANVTATEIYIGGVEA